MNPFTALPPAARRIVYIVFGVLGIVLLGLEAGYSDAPTWVDVYQRVYGALSPLVGITAASNVSTPDDPPAEPPAEEFEGDAAIPGE